MTPIPSADQGFQIVPTAEPGYDAFRIMVPMSVVRPGTAVAAGTTFNAADVPFKHRAPEGWGDYVAGRRETAAPGYLWQNFVRALPTTPTVAEGGYHPVFGRTYIHTYDDLITNTRPDRGDAFTISTAGMYVWSGSAVGDALNYWNGAVEGDAYVALDSRVVLDCVEKDLGQGLCEVKVVTTDNAQVTTVEDEGIDETSGDLVQVTLTHLLTSSRPSSSVTDSAGYYTIVTKKDHNWWLSTTRKASSLPSNEASAKRYTKIERSEVYWPDVMVDHTFLAVLDLETSDYWHQKMFYTIKSAYTGDVQVDYSEWWQAEEPTPPTPVEMVDTPIRIPMEWSEDISIDRCLHPEIRITEYLTCGSIPWTGDAYFQNATYTVPATPYTDWPDEVVKLDVRPMNGGYHCIKRRIKKPNTSISGTQITKSVITNAGYYLSNYYEGPL